MNLGVLEDSFIDDVLFCHASVVVVSMVKVTMDNFATHRHKSGFLALIDLNR